MPTRVDVLKLDDARLDRLSPIHPANRVRTSRTDFGSDPDALERAEGLPHGLNLFVAGLVFALHMLEQFAELVEPGDGVAEIPADDFDLRDGSIEGRLGFLGFGLGGARSTGGSVGVGGPGSAIDFLGMGVSSLGCSAGCGGGLCGCAASADSGAEDRVEFAGAGDASARTGMMIICRLPLLMRSGERASIRSMRVRPKPSALVSSPRLRNTVVLIPLHFASSIGTLVQLAAAVDFPSR